MAGIQGPREKSENGSNGTVNPKTLLGAAATGSGVARDAEDPAPHPPAVSDFAADTRETHAADGTSATDDSGADTEHQTAPDPDLDPAPSSREASDVEATPQDVDDGDEQEGATPDHSDDPEWDPAGEIDTTITDATTSTGPQHPNVSNGALPPAAASTVSAHSAAPSRGGTTSASPEAPSVPGTPAQDVAAVVDNNDGDQDSRRKPWLLVALAGLLAMALGAGGAYWYLANQERQERQAAEASAVAVVQGTFDQLATVSNTADVRRVAGEAEASRSQLNVTEESPGVVTSADAALTAVAALASLNGDTLDTWPTMRAQIEASVAPVATSETAVAAGPGVEAVETVVAKGKDTLALWFLQVLADKNANTEALGAVDRYESAVNVQISRYNELRREASDWVDRARLEGSYRASDAERFFSQASSDRRAVRDSLSALTPPPGLEAQHAELLAVLTAGIDGIESMLDGLYDNDICRYDCYLSETTGYQQFQIASGQITQRYGLAVDNFRAAIAARKAELANTGGPPKPEV